jgi:hypothetical protein
MTEGLLIPAILLGLLGWLVPKLWSMVLPEGFPALAANAVLSAAVLTGITALYFMGVYWAAGVTLARLIDQGVIGNVVYFGRLGLAAAIIWAPMMGIALMGLPRTWVRIRW